MIDDLKLARASAGALLLASKRASRDARGVAGASVDEAVAEANRRKDNTRRVALLGALLVVGHSFAGRLRTAIVDGAAGARRAGLLRAKAELAAAGIDVPADFLEYAARHAAEDMVHAQAVSDAVALSWQSLAVASVTRATRRETSPAKAIETTRAKAIARVETAAKTESARAFVDEHARAVREAANDNAEFAKALKLARVVRVWNSVLEDRTCSPCSSHHGETTDYGSDFDGDEPGDMHPRCLCTAYLATET